MSSSSHTASPFLHIDLAALSHNYQSFQKMIGSSCSLGCVLKANAYGVGLSEIGTHLFQSGARNFFVARCEEGIRLKKTLDGHSRENRSPFRIFILNGLSSYDYKNALTSELIPILSNVEDLATWSKRLVDIEKNFPFGLQVDTGIHRLGLSLEDMQKISSNPREFPMDSCVLFLSHLANSELPLADSNEIQRSLFNSLSAFFPNRERSLANSGGVFLSSQYHYDLVRIGIGLFGIQIPKAFQSQFKNVVSLKAPLIEINEVKQPSSVGYGSTYTIPARGRIGIINLGYGDGYPWSLSNKSLKIQGHTIPIAGRISMDLMALDLSNVPATLLRKGEFVELIGKENPWEEVAQQANLIPHVLLSQMSGRLCREYQRI